MVEECVTERDSRGRGPVGAKNFELFCPKGLGFCLITKTNNNFKKIRGGGLSGIGRPHRLICDRM